MGNDTSKLAKVEYRFIGGINSQVTDAKEMHKFLEVETRFDTWIDRRIEEYGFQHNKDYITGKEKTGGRGRPKTIYHLTIEMAKHLAMAERTEKGREIRDYFLDCERRVKAAVSPQTSLAIPQKRKIIKAELVIVYSDGAPEIQPATPANIDKVLAHLAPKWTTINVKALGDTMQQARKGFAAGFCLWDELNSRLIQRQEVMG